ncbi:hypothetical protein PVAND_017385 [Polypedilum vanderplanki]|uniref:Uncharacterized protein n=1 Tax=Polypedilum vanderplanki TaxID=319348 RepID=A0A9J6BIF6_POLVA|nr:hypothetical protein PVAND_017385 [Polypedilum vanderplanki]
MKFKILFAIFIIFKFVVISNSITINCEFSTIILHAVGYVYRCYTTNIFASLTTSVTSITGEHLDGNKNKDVTALRIDGNFILPFFPRNFSNFFPNMKSITIYSSAIEELFGDEFDEFLQLAYIDISYNRNLHTISSRLFEKTSNMIYIWFNSNQIEKVGRDLFAPIDVSKLQFLGFSDNQCIDRQEVNNGNTTAIISLINELTQKCPYNNEPSKTTTLTSTTRKFKKCFYWDRKSKSRKIRNEF